MMQRRFLLACAVLAGCTTPEGSQSTGQGSPGGTATAERQDAPPPELAADSVVLERGRCLGNCPSYRLRLARSGDIRFESMADGHVSRADSSRLPPESFRELLGFISWAGFLSLPDRIDGHPTFCTQRATDAWLATR